eukprot:gene13746-62947_t
MVPRWAEDWGAGLGRAKAQQRDDVSAAQLEEAPSGGPSVPTTVVWSAW